MDLAALVIGVVLAVTGSPLGGCLRWALAEAADALADSATDASSEIGERHGTQSLAAPGPGRDPIPDARCSAHGTRAAALQARTDARGYFSLEELDRTALCRLPSPLAARIQLALEPDSPAVEVDGPAFTRALAFLIQAQVPAGSEALLHGSVVEDEVRFTLMSGPHEEPTNKAGGELLLGQKGGTHVGSWAGGPVPLEAPAPPTASGH